MRKRSHGYHESPGWGRDLSTHRDQETLLTGTRCPRYCCGQRVMGSCQLRLTSCNLWFTVAMPEIFRSDGFDRWLRELRDVRARARIEARILRLSRGNPGDVKPVGSGVSEMRIDHGPGYRVYFTRRGPLLILLLCGGDKRTQDADIERAIEIAEDWST
ncbi:MAG TPA: type II toxin-antitoxin system RelE/ParE family toxin [Povalibacter sp.]|nr:type II toxin-antitoxin system RelE/ParE family toxin [Povalibacter sp.]